MKSIPIEELLEYLNYSDLRAVRKWCRENQVFITEHGKSEFVFESNFREAYEKPYINMLKRKCGSEWEDVYNLYKDGNIPALNMLNDLTSTPVSIYNTNSNKNNKFIQKLEEYERKKKNAA